MFRSILSRRISSGLSYLAYESVVIFTSLHFTQTQSQSSRSGSFCFLFLFSCSAPPPPPPPRRHCWDARQYSLSVSSGSSFSSSVFRTATAIWPVAFFFFAIMYVDHLDLNTLMGAGVGVDLAATHHSEPVLLSRYAEAKLGAGPETWHRHLVICVCHPMACSSFFMACHPNLLFSFFLSFSSYLWREEHIPLSVFSCHDNCLVFTGMINFFFRVSAFSSWGNPAQLTGYHNFFAKCQYNCTRNVIVVPSTFITHSLQS